MRYSLALLKADVRHEMEEIERLLSEYKEVGKKVDLEKDEIPSYDRGAIGYILHNFYNGCENVFRCIARFFENDVEDVHWHRDLLRRMGVEIPGYRPHVIDEELYRLLDDFRSFRHKFRHSYSYELDWEKERAVAKKLPRAAKMFENQIQQFLSQLDNIDDP